MAWKENVRSLQQPWASKRITAAPRIRVRDPRGRVILIDFWQARTGPKLGEVLARAWSPENEHQFDVAVRVSQEQLTAALERVKCEAERRARAGSYRPHATYSEKDV